MGASPELGHPTATWDIAQVARTPEGKALLKRHLSEITDGPAFRGSPRSAQFLEYIISQSASGNAPDLKERTIGVQLFGRTPTYDTGEDAIVRVTASDVRKRLVQHYSGTGSASEFRINLPSGGYVPELVRVPRVPGGDLLLPFATSGNLEDVSRSLTIPLVSSEHTTPFGWKYWILPVLGGIALTVSVVLAIISHPLQVIRVQLKDRTSAPWASLFDGSRRVLVIPSDPNIEEIQRIWHSNVSLSDYANQSYMPSGIDNLSPTEASFVKEILRGNEISSFDGSIIASLASLRAPGQGRLQVKAARNFRVNDLQTDENLVFLGSPRSNPWTSMFDSALDFQFVFNTQTQREFIRNLHPGKGESAEYIPTAGGFDTGESYALISILHNPGYGGRVLILAGASGEGTEAAGNLVADPARWAAMLGPCHLTQDMSRQSVQILLHLETMAGSPSTVSAVACHLLESKE